MSWKSTSNLYVALTLALQLVLSFCGLFWTLKKKKKSFTYNLKFYSFCGKEERHRQRSAPFWQLVAQPVVFVIKVLCSNTDWDSSLSSDFLFEHLILKSFLFSARVTFRVYLEWIPFSILNCTSTPWTVCEMEVSRMISLNLRKMIWWSNFRNELAIFDRDLTDSLNTSSTKVWGMLSFLAVGKEPKWSHINTLA